jgi:hypothetical protein
MCFKGQQLTAMKMVGFSAWNRSKLTSCGLTNLVGSGDHTIECILNQARLSQYTVPQPDFPAHCPKEGKAVAMHSLMAKHSGVLNLIFPIIVGTQLQKKSCGA